MTRVAGPASAWMSRLLPTAIIRPSCAARACAWGHDASPVQILAEKMTRSAGGGGSASHGGENQEKRRRHAVEERLPSFPASAALAAARRATGTRNGEQET